MTREPRVLIACCGLDHARRGYESFARECFEALRGEPSLDLTLAKGSGRSGVGELVVRTPRRDGHLATALGRALRARPYRIEALAFALALQPAIARARPQVIFLSEWDTARVLSSLRAMRRQPFKLLLSNGGFAWRNFDHLDHVQELTPAALDYIAGRGGDPSRHTVLPLGFHIPPQLTAPDRPALRRELDLPLERRIVISVAALNHSHKRLDYLIEELAALPEPRPYLLLVGEPDRETPAVRALGEERLGASGFEMRTVPAATVPALLRASDVFVLASTVEAQARALVEALIHGVPSLAHDNPVMRFAGGQHVGYADFSQPGALRRLLAKTLRAVPSHARAGAGHRYVYEQFSWDRLRPRYVELLTGLANSTVSSSSGE